MPWENFQNLRIQGVDEERLKRRYSVTSDILSFQRCPRQYGFFAARKYVPAKTAQLYFGTIIHQVLDRAHAHFKGLEDIRTRGQIPTDEDIERYFNEVHEALWIHNIRPFRRDGLDRDAALRRIQIFNRREGPSLYPRVRDTEHRLQNDQGEFILHGTVDVLADDPRWTPGQRAEIWDYKGGDCPRSNTQDFTRFEFQMLVYGELYRLRNGVYPTRGVLYFLGELDNPNPNPMIEIIMNPQRITEAMHNFTETVDRIERCKAENNWLAPTHENLPQDTKTCDACDLRWDCSSTRGIYHIRYP